jgi:hypothetical protein
MQDYSLASKPQRLLLILLVWTARVFSGGVVETFVQSVSAASSSPAVCPYRTINYITHSLPQQCLPASRSALSNTTTIGASGSCDSSSQGPTALTRATHSPSPAATSTQTIIEGIHETSTRTVAHSTTLAAVPEEDADSESPLGKDNFLSFEEWKKRNLDKYGQSPDQVGKSKKHDNLQPRRQPVDVLNSLGDDAEIDLDFSAFASEKPQIAVPSHKDAPDTEAGGRWQRQEAKMQVQLSRNVSITHRLIVQQPS